MNVDVLTDLIGTVLLVMFIIAIFRCGMTKALLAFVVTLVLCLLMGGLLPIFSTLIGRIPAGIIGLVIVFSPVVFVLVKYKKVKPVAA